MTDKEEQHIEIDFDRRETEAGWIRVWDNFGRKATPIWFNWIGWWLLLGVLQYLYQKSHSILIAIVIGISVMLLWIYFQAFFFCLRFKNVPVLKRIKNQLVISIILSGIMTFLFCKAALRIALVVLASHS